MRIELIKGNKKKSIKKTFREIRLQFPTPSGRVPTELYWQPMPGQPTVNELSQISIRSGDLFKFKKSKNIYPQAPTRT